MTRNTILALESGDGARALRFADPAEVQALGLTPQKLSQVLLILRGEPTGPRERWPKLLVEETGNTGTYQATQPLPMQGRPQAAIAILAAETDDGPKALSLVYSLFIYGITTKLGGDDPTFRGESKITSTLRHFDEVAGAFERCGIDGIYLDDPNQPRKLTWSEYRASLNDRLAHARKTQAKPK